MILKNQVQLKTTNNSSKTKKNILNNTEEYSNNTDNKNIQSKFDQELPSEDFFEEKGSESIIEKNDEESKFVDEESYSMAYLTKQQNKNNQQSNLKLIFENSLEGNVKELSKIEDSENLKETSKNEK